MANLKDDLDQYLLLQSDQKKNFKLDMNLLPPMKVPEIGKLFGKSSSLESQTEANSWLKDTQESCCPKLSRFQRIIGFLVCLILGSLCCILSTFYIPVLILKARKFALLYTLGSLFFIASFCFLWGFVSFIKQMFTKSRLFISLSYTGCLLATLYFALFVQSTAFTVVFAVAQVISLLIMIIGAIPGGTSGMKFFGSMFRSTVTNSLPV